MRWIFFAFAIALVVIISYIREKDNTDDLIPKYTAKIASDFYVIANR